MVVFFPLDIHFGIFLLLFTFGFGISSDKSHFGDKLFILLTEYDYKYGSYLLRQIWRNRRRT